MAKTINTVGSQLFQRNLSDYERQENRDDMLARAEANKLGNQLTALGLDPDINDSGLAKIGAAAKADPGGIVGNIASAIGTIKQADAMKLKADANNDRAKLMADMIKSNFGEMTDAEAMMYARDPKALGQMMDLTDYKNRQADRETRNKREEEKFKQLLKQFNREDEAYADEKARRESFEKKKEGFKNTLTEMGVDDASADFFLTDINSFEKMLQDKVWKQYSESEKRSNYNQNKDVFAEFGINDYQTLSMLQQLPQGLATKVFEKGYDQKFVPVYNDLLDERGEAISAYESNKSAAQDIALKNTFSDQEVEAFFRATQVDEDGNPIPEEDMPVLTADQMSGLRLQMLNQARNNKDSQIPQAYNEQVQGLLSPYVQNIQSITSRLGNLTNAHPTLLKIPTFRDTTYRDTAIQRMRPGDFFYNGANRAMVVEAPAMPGGVSFVEETHPSFNEELYEKRHGIFDLESLMKGSAQDSSLGLISAEKAGDVDDSGSARGTDRLNKTADANAEKKKKYEMLLSQAVAKGAKVEAEMASEEIPTKTMFRNLGEFIREEDDLESSLNYLYDSRKDSYYYDKPNFKRLLRDPETFADESSLFGLMRTKNEKNEEIGEELDRRIEILERLLKSVPGNK